MAPTVERVPLRRRELLLEEEEDDWEALAPRRMRLLVDKFRALVLRRLEGGSGSAEQERTLLDAGLQELMSLL